MPPLPVGSLQVAEVTLCTRLKIMGAYPYCASDPEHLVDRTHFIKVFRVPSFRATIRVDPGHKRCFQD